MDKRNKKFILFCLFITTCVFYIPAEENPISSEVESNFDIAAGKHQLESKNLLQTRGMPSGNELRVSLLDLTDAMFLYGAGTATLFYDHEEDDQNLVLRVFLISEDGIEAFHEEKMETTLFDELTAGLNYALGVDEAEAHRVPEMRGIRRMGVRPEGLRSLYHYIGALSELLFPGPIAEKMSAVHRLLIVPARNIGTIPFYLLEPIQRGRALVEDCCISIVPNLNSIIEVLEDPWGSLEFPDYVEDGKFFHPLVLGNPSFPKDDEWMFPPLPGAELEAEQVARMLKTGPLIGKAASKAEVLAHAESADILYFATHGLADPEDPLNGSFLVFADVRNQSSTRWTAGEIQRMRMQADIAVLSACQTGLGMVHNAGIIGLARAFHLAGVRSVIMRLWSIDDAATTDIMISFITFLLEPYYLFPADALREAILEIKNKYPSPSVWASFSLFGVPW